MSYMAELRLLYTLTSSSNPKDHELAVSMIECGDEVFYEDAEGNTLLHVAIRREAFDVIEALLKKEKYPFFLLNKYQNSLALAMRSPNAHKLLKLFSKYCELDIIRCCNCLPWGMSDDHVLTVLWTLLQLAGQMGKSDVKNLFECILSKSRKLMKPLIRTTSNKRFIRIQVLLSYACVLDDTDLVIFLTRKGANLNDRVNRVEQYPLHIACEYCKEETVRLLLRLGADPNVTDRFGVTPLSISFARFGQFYALDGPTMLMIKFLACSTCAGGEINEIDSLIMQSEPILQSFYESCVKELEKMKTIEAADGFSYYCFFSKTRDELSQLVRNPNIFKQLKRSLLPCEPEMFPIFKSEMIARTASRMYKIVASREQELEKVFSGILPCIALRKIACYSYDLKKFEIEYYLTNYSRKF